MKAVIIGDHIKVFARAVHSLAKLGDELYVEPNLQGVSFRTANSSHSAFASFFFENQFFSQFEGVDHSSNDEVNCKVCMKSFLNAFKCLSSVDKSVERVKLSLDDANARLIIQLNCKYTITRSYILSFIECESLKAVFNESQCTHKITTRSKFLNDVFLNFQSSQGEVCIATSNASTALKNYIDDELDLSKVIRTEMVLEREEFDDYQIAGDSEVVFCLKELRSLLTFTDSFHLPVTASFSQPSSPIIFCVENEPFYRAKFVLATLIPSIFASQTTVHNNGTQAKSQRSDAANLRKQPSSMTNMTSNNQADRGDESHVEANNDESVVDVNNDESDVSVNMSYIPENEDCNPLVTESPKRRKGTFIFKRCLNSTQLDLTSSSNIILANDSDTDD